MEHILSLKTMNKKNISHRQQIPLRGSSFPFRCVEPASVRRN